MLLKQQWLLFVAMKWVGLFESASLFYPVQTREKRFTEWRARRSSVHVFFLSSSLDRKISVQLAGDLASAILVCSESDELATYLPHVCPE